MGPGWLQSPARIPIIILASTLMTLLAGCEERSSILVEIRGDFRQVAPANRLHIKADSDDDARTAELWHSWPLAEELPQSVRIWLGEDVPTSVTVTVEAFQGEAFVLGAARPCPVERGKQTLCTICLESRCVGTDPPLPGCAEGECISVGGDADADADTDADAEEDCPEGERVWYRDADGDGWGSEDEFTRACHAPEGWIALTGDCDDNDPERHPEAAEYCNGVDDDCDGETDEDGLDGVRVYFDGDRDGWGQSDISKLVCQMEDERWTRERGDCNDENAAVHPMADEVCNAADDDCDDVVDETGCEPCQHFDALGSTYLFCEREEERSWDDARDYCRERGYDLVVIMTPEEQTSLAARAAEPDAEMRHYWIGLRWYDRDQALEWIDGSPTTYLAWGDGEPRPISDPEPRCANMDRDLDYRWSARLCSEEFGFICEIPW